MTLATVKRSNVNNTALECTDGAYYDSWECRKIEWHGKLVFVNLYLLLVYCIYIFFVDWYYFFVNCKTYKSIAEYYTYEFVIFCQLLNYSLV